MNKTFLAALAFLLFSGLVSAQKISLKTGEYNASLKLNASTILPVRMSVEKSGSQSVIVIKNAEERILLTDISRKGDTIIMRFPEYDSEIRAVAKKKRTLDGYWINFNKANNYRIPFHADLKSSNPEKRENPEVNITGRWESYFDPGSENAEAAIGVFQQDGSRVTGTFMTETGDYRFMEGIVTGNRFYLSAFDGSHAFLISGSVQDSVIIGTFHSGKHYQTTLRAERNESFELRDPETLTYVTKESEVSFSIKDLSGKDFVFPNEQTDGKVIIIQIMGTWCPNCMDETNYFKTLYERFHPAGLEIISIGYEAPDTFEEQAAKIRRLKDKQQLPFIFLVGGKASKDSASRQFSMLNQVMSFPTTIFIGRDGEVKRIHTGFNGPGTGTNYTEYVEKTDALVQQLLGE